MLLVCGACTADRVDGRDTTPPSPPSREPVWSVLLPAAAGEAEQATVAGDLVVVATSAAVVGLDRSTGESRWLVHSTAQTPYVTADALVTVARLAGDHDGPVTVYDLVTGAERFVIPSEFGDTHRVTVT
ncbi:MAG: hypothetical protein ACRD0U_18285, partial [Acidimicrobiales bacterium]